MNGGTHIELEDLALLASQAASAEEHAAMQQHLVVCPQCRAELVKLSTELSMVAMSVDQHPLPEGARQRFVDRIATAPAERASQPVAVIPQKSRGRAITTWIPWAVAAVLALLAITMGIRINSLNRENREQARMIGEFAYTESRAQKVLDVLTAPDAQHVVLTTTKAAQMPSARAVYLPSRGGLVFQASNMGQLTQEWTYELWVIPANGSAPIPAGLFRPDATGSASVVLPDLPVGVAAKAFGVTVERAAGSAKPTLPIILSGAAPTS